MRVAPGSRAASAGAERDGVSIVVPVHNGAVTLPAVLEALERECDSLRMAGVDTEILLVDDHSRDASRELLDDFARRLPDAERIAGEGRGATAALNLAVRRSRYRWIAQIDQDVVPQPGWLIALLEETARLEAARRSPTTVGSHGSGRVAAVQADFSLASAAPLLARVNDLDLDDRYRRRERSSERRRRAPTASPASVEAHHVCTGNTLYRREALLDVGLFDETLGYGYDNDLSYRLSQRGWALYFHAGAKARHLDRHRWSSWLRRQYGLGYGRLDLVARHPDRIAGDDVSGPDMILHAAAGWAIWLLIAMATAFGLAGLVTELGPGGAAFATRLLGLAGLLSLGILAERAVAAARIFARRRDPAVSLVPILHLLRDLAWGLAIHVWIARRLARLPSSPGHSMASRQEASEP